MRVIGDKHFRSDFAGAGKRRSSLRKPGIIGAHAPGMALGILDRELSAAIPGILYRLHNRGSCRLRLGVDGVGIWHNDVGTASLESAQFSPVL